MKRGTILGILSITIMTLLVVSCAPEGPEVVDAPEQDEDALPDSMRTPVDDAVVETPPEAEPEEEPEAEEEPAALAPAQIPGCPSAEDVKKYCRHDELPTLTDGCTFEVQGTKTGTIWFTAEGSSVDAFVREVNAIPGLLEDTYELKKRAGRREQQPFTWFFWLTEEDVLITAKAHKTACTSDALKKLLLSIGPEQFQPEPLKFCGTSTKYECVLDVDCKISGEHNEICQAKVQADKESEGEYEACMNPARFAYGCYCRQGGCTWS